MARKSGENDELYLLDGNVKKMVLRTMNLIKNGEAKQAELELYRFSIKHGPEKTAQVLLVLKREVHSNENIESLISDASIEPEKTGAFKKFIELPGSNKFFKELRKISGINAINPQEKDKLSKKIEYIAAQLSKSKKEHDKSPANDEKNAPRKERRKSLEKNLTLWENDIDEIIHKLKSSENAKQHDINEPARPSPRQARVKKTEPLYRDLYKQGVIIGVNSASNKLYTANTAAKRVSVINIATRDVVAVIDLNNYPIAISVDHISNRIFIANKRDWPDAKLRPRFGDVTVIDGKRDKVIAEISVNDPTGIDFNPETGIAYVSDGLGKQALAIDGRNYKIIKSIKFRSPLNGICVNHRTNMIYAATDSKAIAIINGADNKAIKALPLTSNPINIVVNHQTNRIYAAHYAEFITVIGSAANKVIGRIPIENGAIGLCVNQAANIVYAVNKWNKTIDIIDGETNKVIGNIDVPGNDPHRVEYNPSFNHFYVSKRDCDIVDIIDADNNRIIGRLPDKSFGLGMSGASFAGDEFKGPELSEEAAMPGVSIAVNSTTNKIYAANGIRKHIIVVDGIDNSFIAAIDMINSPAAIAVNNIANLIFVANRSRWLEKSLISDVDNLAVIDGSTDKIIDKIAIDDPNDICVNHKTGMVYATSAAGKSVVVIDGLKAKIVAVAPLNFKPKGIAVSAASNLIYASGDSNNVAVINGSNNKVIDSIAIPEGSGKIALNLETNKIYVVHANGFVTVIDAAKNKTLDPVFIEKGAVDIAVNPLTNLIYALNRRNKVVVVINGATDQVVDVIALPGNEPCGISVNPAANLIYATKGDSDSVEVIDGAKNKIIASFPARKLPAAGDAPVPVIEERMAFSKLSEVVKGGRPAAAEGEPQKHKVVIGVNTTTSKIYAAGGISANINVFERATKKIIAVVKMTEFPVAIAVNCVANRVYVAAKAKQTGPGQSAGIDNVTVIDGATDQIIKKVPVNAVKDVDVNPETGFAYATNTADKTVVVIDGEANEAIKSIKLPFPPFGVGVNPNTNLVYVAMGQKIVAIIDGASNKEIAAVLVNPNPETIAINPIANKIYVTHANDCVTVIEGKSNKTLKPISIKNGAAGIGINPAANLLYAVEKESKTVVVINGATDKITGKIVIPCKGAGLTNVNPAINTIYATKQDSDEVEVIDGASNEIVETLPAKLTEGGKAPIAPELNALGVSEKIGLIPVGAAALAAAARAKKRGKEPPIDEREDIDASKAKKKPGDEDAGEQEQDAEQLAALKKRKKKAAKEAGAGAEKAQPEAAEAGAEAAKAKAKAALQKAKAAAAGAGGGAAAAAGVAAAAAGAGQAGADEAAEMEAQQQGAAKITKKTGAMAGETGDGAEFEDEVAKEAAGKTKASISAGADGEAGLEAEPPPVDAVALSGKLGRAATGGSKGEAGEAAEAMADDGAQKITKPGLKIPGDLKGETGGAVTGDAAGKIGRPGLKAPGDLEGETGEGEDDSAIGGKFGIKKRTAGDGTEDAGITGAAEAGAAMGAKSGSGEGGELDKEELQIRDAANAQMKKEAIAAGAKPELGPPEQDDMEAGAAAAATTGAGKAEPEADAGKSGIAATREGKRIAPAGAAGAGQEAAPTEKGLAAGGAGTGAGASAGTPGERAAKAGGAASIAAATGIAATAGGEEGIPPDATAKTETAAKGAIDATAGQQEAQAKTEGAAAAAGGAGAAGAEAPGASAAEAGGAASIAAATAGGAGAAGTGTPGAGAAEAGGAASIAAATAAGIAGAGGGEEGIPTDASAKTGTAAKVAAGATAGQQEAQAETGDDATDAGGDGAGQAAGAKVVDKAGKGPGGPADMAQKTSKKEEKDIDDDTDFATPVGPAIYLGKELRNYKAKPTVSNLTFLTYMSFIAKLQFLPNTWTPPMDPAMFKKSFDIMELIVPPNGPFNLFREITLLKAHVNTAKVIGKGFEKFIKGVCDGICQAISITHLLNIYTGVKINGPVGTVTPGNIMGPPLMPMILLFAPKNTLMEMVWSTCVAIAIGKAWDMWRMGLTGNLIYPMFAVFPGPFGPPMPSIPLPLMMFTSSGESQFSPSALKGQMMSNLNTFSGVLKAVGVNTNSIHAPAFFGAISEAFFAVFQMYKAMTLMMPVIGMGPIPSFAPPFVPVGPVVGGTTLPIPAPFLTPPMGQIPGPTGEYDIILAPFMK